tara:strand:- start:367 stop:642 length:276 start_codon:yes stop_codon:yes gene_type:complete
MHDNVVCIDVDGTLLKKGKINKNLIDWIRLNRKKFKIYLWSLAGESHARNVAKKFKLELLFDEIISKPHLIIDDRGWSWIKETRVIKINGT